MLKSINKIPAGTFLVPMILSAFIYTFWPDLFHVGGLTEGLLSGSGMPFITGALSFFSGTGMKLGALKKVVKNHGVLLLARFIVTIVLGLLYISIFGQGGILGISAIAFIVAIGSINPAVYLALVNDFGKEEDKTVFGITSLFAIPLVPVFIYSLSSAEGFEWMSLISTLIPVILGIILGNIDQEFHKLFGPGVAALLPLLGWNIGQGLNLIEATQSGLVGLLLVGIYYLVNLYQLPLDTKVLKNNGVASLSMMSAAGVSLSTPAVIGAMNPEYMEYTSTATAQVLTVVVITSILTPIIVKRYSKNKL